jgi:beta-glucosidase
VEPVFEFGHGLSYTTFNYSNLLIQPTAITPDATVTISIDITNTGTCAGAEVVQLYIRDEYSSVTTPVKQLRGIYKLMLNVEQTSTVTFTLGPSELQLFNSQYKWIVEVGWFTVMIGSSSKNILATGRFQVIENTKEEL